MPATRKQRLQEALRAELSEVIRREMRDPRLTEGLLSVTDVEVSTDLKYATVYISVLGDAQARKDSLTALRGAAGLLRGVLGRRNAFKSVPELSFKYDEAMERGTHVFDLLEQVKREDAARPKPPTEETDDSHTASADDEDTEEREAS